MSRRRNTASIPNTAPCQQMTEAIQIIKKEGYKVGDEVAVAKKAGNWITRIRFIAGNGSVYLDGDNFAYHPRILMRVQKPAPS